MRSRVLWFVLALSTMASTVLASDGGIFNWAYQRTGFQSSGMQTALAMGDGYTWPVVFSNSCSPVQAYSLYPVINPQTQTYWHQIGTNILWGDGILSAATSPDGRVGVVERNSQGFSGSAVVGSRSSGFGAVMQDTMAIDFDREGNLIQGTMNTLPPLPNLPGGPLVDIAASPFGNLGAVNNQSCYYERSPLLGWQGVDLRQVVAGPGLGENVDLTMDSLGRPHIVGPATNSPPSFLVAYDFDIATGRWTWQTLSNTAISLATIASDSNGGVGAAWVQDNGLGSLALMYAYNDGVHDWATQMITSSVFDNGHFESVTLQQKVGLAFDANDLPVISFLAGPCEIWLAYDPPATVPEPSTLILLGAAAAMIAGGFWYRRAC